jgi:hypothetical protein
LGADNHDWSEPGLPIDKRHPRRLRSGTRDRRLDSYPGKRNHNRALATEYGPAVVSTGEALATQVADEGYLMTAEALLTQGANELIPTIEAFATESLFPASPPEDIPIFPDGDVTNLFSNQSVVSYYVDADLPDVVEFYKNTMPTFEWLDVSDDDEVREDGAVLKFFKPERVATVALTANPVADQTIVLITIRSQ